MAKKNSTESAAGGCTVADLISKVDDSTEIISQSRTATIKDYIPTGSYILNAAITGSIFKGMPAGRVMTLAGDPGTGKTYLAVSICREAQKKGYSPIYIDTEGSIDAGFVERLGCDSDTFWIKTINTISDVSNYIAKLCQQMLGVAEEKRPKIILVLDSLSNLTSDKEMKTTLEGSGVRDMTKQQEVKALFRTNAVNLAKLGIPFIVNCHIYQTQELFSKTVVSGGSGINYNSSVTLLLSTSKYDDKESDKIVETKTGTFTKTGVTVSAKLHKSRFTKSQIVKFYIPFFKAPNPYVGLEAYLSWENSGILRGKMLTEKEYAKLSPAEQATCHEMTNENGEKAYAFPKDTSTKIVVSHLHGEVPLKELWSSKVLTDDLLHSLDESIIKPSFELPTYSSTEDLDDMLGDNEESK